MYLPSILCPSAKSTLTRRADRIASEFGAWIRIEASGMSAFGPFLARTKKM